MCCQRPTSEATRMSLISNYTQLLGGTLLHQVFQEYRKSGFSLPQV